MDAPPDAFHYAPDPHVHEATQVGEVGDLNAIAKEPPATATNHPPTIPDSITIPAVHITSPLYEGSQDVVGVTNLSQEIVVVAAPTLDAPRQPSPVTAHENEHIIIGVQ